MSVCGIDVGNDTSCVALARKRGIDVVGRAAGSAGFQALLDGRPLTTHFTNLLPSTAPEQGVQA